MCEVIKHIVLLGFTWFSTEEYRFKYFVYKNNNKRKKIEYCFNRWFNKVSPNIVSCFDKVNFCWSKFVKSTVDNITYCWTRIEICGNNRVKNYICKLCTTVTTKSCKCIVDNRLLLSVCKSYTCCIKMFFNIVIDKLANIQRTFDWIVIIS